MSVEYEGEKYNIEIKNGLITLDLSNKTISDMTRIKGLEKLSQLQVLFLNGNLIKEIRGLRGLKNLQRLDLFKNLITNTTGLEQLPNLQELNLVINHISEMCSKMLSIPKI